MSGEITADYVLELAQRVERNGRDFYLMAAGMVQKASTEQTLRSLAAMESDHEQVFATMRAHLPTRDESGSVDPTGEAASYLRALVRGKFFDANAGPGSYFTHRESVRDILLTAIGLEKETITFYTGVKELLTDEKDKQAVEQIIREEMHHISRLGGQLQLYW